MPYQNSNQRSWWEKTSLARPRDLIIVGSGITGLSAALFYKRLHPNKSVMVLDRGFWPHGATARNAGFACFGSAGELVDDLSLESEEEVRNRLESRFRGLELLKRELGESEMEYSMCGGYELFDTHDEEMYQTSMEMLPVFNEWVRLYTGEKDSYITKDYNGYKTIFNRLEGYLHSGKMLQTLAQKAQSIGVEIRWNTPVETVQKGEVILQDGLVLKADHILSAVNGFSKNLISQSSVVPARGYIFVTKPLNSLKWKGTCHYNKGYVYFRDLGNRLLLGGARDIDKKTEESYTPEINQKIKEWLIQFANGKLDLEEGWEIEQEWTGTMGFSSSKTPECKKVSDGIWIAAGLGGMGVALGMELGRKAAEMIN
jgi:gamma-glutamylputrescine oxidase